MQPSADTLEAHATWHAHRRGHTAGHWGHGSMLLHLLLHLLHGRLLLHMLLVRVHALTLWGACVCVCVCACVRARPCACACTRACVNKCGHECSVLVGAHMQVDTVILAAQSLPD